jgi:Flp pilus assembly protein TadG
MTNLRRNPGKRFRGRLRDILRFLRNRRGATAVEFAIIAPLFIGLLLSILETGIYFFAQNVLQTASVQAGRLFLTGQAQASSLTEAKLISDVCPSIQTLFNCNNLMVDVNTYSSFGGANVSTPTLTYNAQGQVTNSWNYNIGTAGQIMVVRLMYQWPVVTGPLALLIPKVTNGTSLIMGITAFKIEP